MLASIVAHVISTCNDEFEACVSPRKFSTRQTHCEPNRDHCIIALQPPICSERNRIMSLSGQQIAQIQEALLEAYDESGLTQMLRTQMDVKLEHVAGGEI